MRYLFKTYTLMCLASFFFHLHAATDDYDCVFPSGLNVFDETGKMTFGEIHTRIHQDSPLYVKTGNFSNSGNTDKICVKADGTTYPCQAADKYAPYLNLPNFPETLSSSDFGGTADWEVTQYLANAGDTLSPAKKYYSVSMNFTNSYVISNKIKSKFYNVSTANGAEAYFKYEDADTPFVITNLNLGSPNNSTATFEPGTYYIENINIQDTTHIVVKGIGDGSGTVKFYVKNSVSFPGGYYNFDSNVANADQDASKLIVVSYTGNITTSSGTKMAGYLYAPNGDVTMNAAGSYGVDTVFVGGVTAHNIQFQDGMYFYYPKDGNRLGDDVCGGSTYVPPGAIDVIEHSSYITDYAGADKSIFTKIVDKPAAYEVVALDADGNEQIYNGSFTNNKQTKTVNLAVLLYTADDTCSEDRQFLWGGEIAHNTSHTEASNAVITSAAREQRIKAYHIDYASLIPNADSLNCSQSSLSSSLCLVPACMNDTGKITDVFDPSVYPYITTCTDGANAPCNSNAYSGNCGGRNPQKTVSPAKYDHKYGCAACIADALANASCSTDDFAVRPDRFAVSSGNAAYPDYLRAGEDYNLTVNAYNYGSTTNTPDYNQTGGSGGNLDLNQTLRLSDDTVATPDQLEGNLVWSAWDFNVSNGLSVRSGYAGNDVAGVQFDNVGNITLGVQDRQWAQVDNDDTPQNCSGTWVCGENNVTYIPHHFAFTGLTITDNNATRSFTYLSNLDPADTATFEMAARVQTTVEARNKNDGVTTNFKSGPLYYENPVSLALSVKDAAVGNANATSIDDALLGFGLNGDDNGTKTLKWDETNATKMLCFNFPRVVNEPRNPFKVSGGDLNISATSDYSGGTAIGRVYGDENGTAAGTANFYFGRAHAPRYRIEGDGSGTSGDITLFYEIYCDECEGGLLGPVAPNRKLSVDDISWYQNELHLTPDDGNVSALTDRTDGKITESYIDVRSTWHVYYDKSRGYPFKQTIRATVSPWLLYHRFNIAPSTNDFTVEFSGKGAAVGKDKGNIGVDSKSYIRTMRRIEW